MPVVDCAVLYLRQSQDRTGQGYGVDRQRDDGCRLAQLREWRIVGEQIDPDISASGKKVRPGFEEVLRMLRAGEAKVVIAWDMSRLTRNARDTLRLLEAGQEAGAILAFVRGTDLNLSTADGRTLAGILSSIAQGEIDKKSERQRRAAAQAADQGRRIAGRRAFGYGVQIGVDPETGKPILDYDQLHPEEAPALQDAYRAILSGVRRGTVARGLNDRGLLPPQGHRDGTESRWTSAGLRSVLLNPRNAGLRSHATEALLKSMPAEKARIAGVVGDAVWPGIVDEATWRAVVAKTLETDGSRAGRAPQRFLTGTAICGLCGATVHSGTNAPGVPNYRCTADYGHLSPRSEPIDAHVVEFVHAFLSRPDVAAELGSEEQDETATLISQRRGLRQRMNEQMALHASGDIDTEQLRSGTALLRRQLEAVDRRLESTSRRSALSLVADHDDPAQAWLDMTVDQRRAFLGRLFVVKLFSPGRGAKKFKPESVVITRGPRG